MFKLNLIILILIIYFLFSNNNIEKFSLNFPENNLKCKCDLEDEFNIEKPNNIVENFTNYNKSKIKENKKLNRIYNIYPSPYDDTAETYFKKKYFYPIVPLSESDKILSSNEQRYKNIGNSNHKILNKEYILNDNIGYYHFNDIN